MKKLAILVSAVVLGGLSVMAQGTIQFQNASTFPIKVATGTDAASLAAATVIGSNATSVSLGAGLGQVNVQMYVSLASAPTQFFLAGSTTNSGSTLSSFQGTFHGGNPYTIPASVDGGLFQQGTTIDYYFAAQTQNGIYSGTSAIGTGYVLAGGATSPGVTFGSTGGLIPGFTITAVPEPSTIILSGLGAAAMLLYRRKK